MSRKLAIVLILLGLNTVSLSEEIASFPLGFLPLSLSAVGSSPSEEPTGMAITWGNLETVGTVEEGEEAMDLGVSVSISFEF